MLPFLRLRYLILASVPLLIASLCEYNHRISNNPPLSKTRYLMAVNLILVLSAVLGCSANPDRVRNSPKKNGSRLDQANSTMSPDLFRELRHRSPPLVDVQSIPSGDCLFGSECTYPTPDLNDIPSCPLYPTHCPADSTEIGRASCRERV